MKNLFKSYTSFTRTERMGLVCICALVILLIIIRATMSLWVHPTMNAEDEKKLATAWEAFKRAHPAIKDSSELAGSTEKSKSDFKDAFDDNTTPLPNVIDLNTADSATLVRLKGIGPVTAGKIIARRKEIGPFTNVNQLLEIRHIPEATFEVLKKHLTVNSSLH